MSEYTSQCYGRADTWIKFHFHQKRCSWNQLLLGNISPSHPSTGNALAVCFGRPLTLGVDGKLVPWRWRSLQLCSFLREVILERWQEVKTFYFMFHIHFYFIEILFCCPVNHLLESHTLDQLPLGNSLNNQLALLYCIFATLGLEWLGILNEMIFWSKDEARVPTFRKIIVCFCLCDCTISPSRWLSWVERADFTVCTWIPVSQKCKNNTLPWAPPAPKLWHRCRIPWQDYGFVLFY